jgi:lysozyme
MQIVLPEKPRLNGSELRALIAPYAIDRVKYPLVVVGIRGYYKHSMGAPNVNDRGIYDDAIFIDSAQATVAYNGNTDPSAYRLGMGTGARKGIASLNPGAWFVHKFDLHKGKYLALCQRAGDVTVTRDGTPPYTETGHFGINIHRGGYNTTSSEGCQTIHPSQWDSFIGLAEDQARRYSGSSWKNLVIPYVLLVA